MMAVSFYHLILKQNSRKASELLVYNKEIQLLFIKRNRSDRQMNIINKIINDKKYWSEKSRGLRKDNPTKIQPNKN